MKPATTTKHHAAVHSANLPAAPQRVTVEFLPDTGWQVEIGRTPVKVFAAPQTRRDKGRSTGYKRAHGRSQPQPVFVPVGLMMAAAKQQATPRYGECRATPKQPVNL